MDELHVGEVLPQESLTDLPEAKRHIGDIELMVSRGALGMLKLSSTQDGLSLLGHGLGRIHQLYLRSNYLLKQRLE